MELSQAIERYEIIDAHAHIFPGKIAQRASGSIGKFYDLPMRYTGYPHELVESGDAIGVTTYLVCSTATRPEQVESINNFIQEKCEAYPQFFGFATLHPDLENWEFELQRVIDLGLHGIKLHPDFQEFYIDDPKNLPMYRGIAQAGLPILFHMGDEPYDFSQPRRLSKVLDQVPGLRCIAAHFGGWQRWEESYDCLADYPQASVDTCSSLKWLTREQVLRFLDRFGEERFFFGTDFPMWDHRAELGRFLALELTDRQNRLLLSENFKRFFKLNV